MRPVSLLKTIRSALEAWFGSWAAWVTLCILWVLCWLTVVLGPPATFALAQTANYAALGVEPNFQEALAAGKRYFGLSWQWMAANLAVGFILWANRFFYSSFPGNVWTIARPVLVLLGLAWIVIQYFALAYLMVQERKNLLIAWRSALGLVWRAPGYALAASGFGLLVGLISLVLVAPLAVGGPALVALVANQAVIDAGSEEQS